MPSTGFETSSIAKLDPPGGQSRGVIGGCDAEPRAVGRTRLKARIRPQDEADLARIAEGQQRRIHPHVRRGDDGGRLPRRDVEAVGVVLEQEALRRPLRSQPQLDRTAERQIDAWVTDEADVLAGAQPMVDLRRRQSRAKGGYHRDERERTEHLSHEEIDERETRPVAEPKTRETLLRAWGDATTKGPGVPRARPRRRRCGGSSTGENASSARSQRESGARSQPIAAPSESKAVRAWLHDSDNVARTRRRRSRVAITPSRSLSREPSYSTPTNPRYPDSTTMRSMRR